ncbi:MAG: HDIG domain-containing metalloprotein [Kofleriaceae bacterium]
MIAHRPHVGKWASLILAIGFGVVVLPIVTADYWLAALGGARVVTGEPAPLTVRVPPFAGAETLDAGRIGGGGGVVIARGDVATRDDEFKVAELASVAPSGPRPYAVMFLVLVVLAGGFSVRARRSLAGRLVRVQVVNLAAIAVLAAIVKIVMLATPTNVLIVPVAMLALLPALALDRVVGLATGAVAAVTIALCVPFDLGVATLLLAQITVTALVVAERPKHRAATVLRAGAAATIVLALAYPALQFLTTGKLPLAELSDPVRSAWVAATLGPAIATVLAWVLVPFYQVLVGELTHGKLIALEDRSQPLLVQIAEKSPGSWQASLMIANLADNAANAIGANGRLVRVGAYYHDLGKSLQPKYFIENLEPGETSPHDKLPPDASCDAIFAHVTEGIIAARKAGLHERIVDFMATHHGGTLDYFWDKCREHGNPKGLTADYFRYPGLLPQTRETAILAICDAVEAASRTIKRSDPTAIESLVQRIVYGKLHGGQLDEAGLSMAELRRITASLCETIRLGIHGRTDNVLAHAEQSASATSLPISTTAPRLDSHDRSGKVDPIRVAAKPVSDDALQDTEAVGATPKLRKDAPPLTGPHGPVNNELANSATAPIPLLEKRAPRDSDGELATTGRVEREVAGQRGAELAESRGRILRDSRDSQRDVARAIADAAERARAADDDARGTRDLRREADRAAMAARYAADGSRDSDPGTKEFERDSNDGVEPRSAPRSSEPVPSALSSRDGSRRVQHSKPSDGDDTPSNEPRVRANKRTNETDARNRVSGDFVANMVLQPLIKDAIPTSLSDGDTGRHGKPPIVKDSSREIDLFAAEATRALQAAAPDLDVLPAAAPHRGGPRALSESDASRPHTDSSVPRKRAATLPPIPGLQRPPTIAPPMRRAGTVPPTARPPTPALIEQVEPADRSVGKTLFGGAANLRPPAKREDTGPQPVPAVVAKVDTSTNPVLPRGIDVDASRDDRARARDDAAATQPAMAAIKPSDLDEVGQFARRRADAAATRPVPKQEPEDSESSTTQPAMPRAIADADSHGDVGDVTEPALLLPTPAPVFADDKPWARGLAARIDASLDDDFGRETPAHAPSRAELQALVDAPPDATRQQSLEEIERLRIDPAARRSEEELQFVTPRRSPYPTAEVSEDDIEAAIEIAPSARRTGSIPIGIAKKKPSAE